MSLAGLLIAASLLAGLALEGLLNDKTGWRRLAERFRKRGPFRGRRERLESGRVGKGNFSMGLTVGGSPEHLLVAAAPWYRSGRPSLLIPWSEITVRKRVGIRVDVEFVVAGMEDEIIRLNPPVVFRMWQDSGEAFDLPDIEGAL